MKLLCDDCCPETQSKALIRAKKNKKIKVFSIKLIWVMEQL